MMMSTSSRMEMMIAPARQIIGVTGARISVRVVAVIEYVE
jgi:hypothetical protein